MTAALLLLAVALLIAPARPTVRARLRAVTGRGRPARRSPPAHLVLPVSAAVACGALVAVLGSVPVAVVLACVTLPVFRHLLRPDRGTAPDPLALAATWDLLAATLRAGLAVPAAIRAVAADVPGTAGHGLRSAADLLALGADPVDAWAPALAHPATAALARGARRSARSGSALASVAAGLAAEVRATATDAAESRAQRAAVLITGPLGLCFLPAFVCLGIAPVVLGLATKLSTQL